MTPLGSTIAAVWTACLLWAGRPAAASPCGQAARVDGPSRLAAALRAELTARGVAAPADEGCAETRVHIAQRDARSLLVIITTPDQRRIVRHVANVAEAAMVVDTWVRRDLDAPLLAPRLLARPSVNPVEMASDGETPTNIVAAAPASRGASRRVTARAGSAAVVATDGSVWTGLQGGACVTLGRTCIGAAASWLLDTKLTGDSEHFETRRSTLDMLITLELPLAVGPLALTPSVGVGIGTMRIRRVAGATSGVDGDKLVQDERGGARAFGRIDAGVALSDRLRLTVGFAVSTSPSAQSSAFMDDGVEVAGEPRAYVWTIIGLQVNAL